MSLKKSNIRPRVSESSEEFNFEDRKNDRRVSWGLMRIREYTSNIEESEFSPVPNTVNRTKIPMIEPADLYTAPIESPSTASNLIHSSTVIQGSQADRREDIMDISEPLSPRSESPARFMKGMDLIQEFNKIGAEEMSQEAKYNPILTPVIEENDAMQICSTDDSNTLLSSSNPVQQCIPSTPSQVPLLRYTPNLSAKLTPKLSSIPESSSRNHYTSLIEKNKLTPLKPISCNIFTSHRLTPSKRNLFSYSEETEYLKAELENCNQIAREVEMHNEAVMGQYKLKQEEYSKRYREFKDYLVDYVNGRASITEQFPIRLTDESSRMEDWWFGDCRWIQ